MKPERTCIVCRNKYPKSTLIRISKTKNGEFLIDANIGRGAYVCKNTDCIANLKKRKSLNRAFRCEVPPQVYQQLQTKVGTND